MEEYIPSTVYTALTRKPGGRVEAPLFWHTWGRAGAGLAIVTSDLSHILVTERASHTMEGGTISTPGGAREEFVTTPTQKLGVLEDPLTTAVVETREELGSLPNGRIRATPYVFQKPRTDFTYHTFVLEVNPAAKEDYTPSPNHEITRAYWTSLSELQAKARQEWTFPALHLGFRHFLLNYDFAQTLHDAPETEPISSDSLYTLLAQQDYTAATAAHTMGIDRFVSFLATGKIPARVGGISGTLDGLYIDPLTGGFKDTSFASTPTAKLNTQDSNTRLWSMNAIAEYMYTRFPAEVFGPLDELPDHYLAQFSDIERHRGYAYTLAGCDTHDIPLATLQQHLGVLPLLGGVQILFGPSLYQRDIVDSLDVPGKELVVRDIEHGCVPRV